MFRGDDQFTEYSSTLVITFPISRWKDSNLKKISFYNFSLNYIRLSLSFEPLVSFFFVEDVLEMSVPI